MGTESGDEVSSGTEGLDGKTSSVEVSTGTSDAGIGCTEEASSGTEGTEGSTGETGAEGVRVESVGINVSDGSDISGKEGVDGISGGLTEGGCSGAIVSDGRSEGIVSASDLGGKTVDVGLIDGTEIDSEGSNSGLM